MAYTKEILGTGCQIWPRNKKHLEHTVKYGLQVRNIMDRLSNMACRQEILGTDS